MCVWHFIKGLREIKCYNITCSPRLRGEAISFIVMVSWISQDQFFLKPCCVLDKIVGFKAEGYIRCSKILHGMEVRDICN